jgi:hypothetical protein
MNLPSFYRLSLTVGIAKIWALMTAAKFAPYDVNYVFAGMAFLMSAALTLLVFLVFVYRRGLIRETTYMTPLFLITASPIAVFSFLEFYTRFVGQYFRF